MNNEQKETRKTMSEEEFFKRIKHEHELINAMDSNELVKQMNAKQKEVFPIRNVKDLDKYTKFVKSQCHTEELEFLEKQLITSYDEVVENIMNRISKLKEMIK